MRPLQFVTTTPICVTEHLFLLRMGSSSSTTCPGTYENCTDLVEIMQPKWETDGMQKKKKGDGTFFSCQCWIPVVASLLLYVPLWQGHPCTILHIQCLSGQLQLDNNSPLMTHKCQSNVAQTSILWGTDCLLLLWWCSDDLPCGMNTNLYLQWPLFVNTLVGAAMTNYKKKIK